MEQAVARSVLDSRTMAPGEGLAMFREAAEVLYEFRPHETAEVPSICFEAYSVGDIVIDRFRASCANSYERSRSRIGRDGRECFMLQTLVAGRWAKRDGSVDAGAGDLVVLDMAQPQSMLGTDKGTLHLYVPRRLFASRLSVADEHNMRVIRGTEPLAKLYHSYLSTLVGQLPSMSVGEAEAAISCALDLAAAAVNGRGREEQAGAIQLAIVDKIRQYINTHIYDAELTVEHIASHFGLSRRKLYYLFEACGGLYSHIVAKRLHLSRAAITDPTRCHETIGDIAKRYGFRHYRSFARAFERQFGISPRAMRALSAAGQSHVVYDGDDRVIWTKWLRDLK